MSDSVPDPAARAGLPPFADLARHIQDVVSVLRELDLGDTEPYRAEVPDAAV
ncbi:hypothetical protein [Actinokineospora terrae]|uniref:Uncharacterized protein n=1 Tax=Actinokineospora terrae TaxID=155974 RepID=A0A1H9MLI9_9PSEU|nr:hypothetical protein [Actinokineospora terrae]SER24325.1 hypothetical protein SAMN04487818_102213 [Actinokineospora terrae]